MLYLFHYINLVSSLKGRSYKKSRKPIGTKQSSANIHGKPILSLTNMEKTSLQLISKKTRLAFQCNTLYSVRLASEIDLALVNLEPKSKKITHNMYYFECLACAELPYEVYGKPNSLVRTTKFLCISNKKEI